MRNVASTLLTKQYKTRQKTVLPYQLFPFQKTGVEFLLNHKRCLLADEMGLGKTVQVLESIRTLSLQGDSLNILIICPASLRLMWKEEIKKWSWKDINFIVVSYNYLQKASNVNILKNTLWSAIVSDEAHALKNAKSKTCQGFMKVCQGKDAHVWMLTGTPATKSGQDYYPYLEIIQPGKWGSFFEFSNMFCNVSINYMGYREFKGVKESKKPILKHVFSKIMLRRTKDKVLEELPTKITRTIPVEVDETIISECLNIDSEIIRAAIDKDKPLPAHVMKVMRAIGMAKEEAALEYCLGVKEPLVVFCNHVDVVENLKNGLKRNGKTVGTITGKDSPTDKDKNTKDFQEGRSEYIICNLKAGGVGVTLHRASHILVVELYWSVSVMEQALARIDRIGQKATCLQITYLVAPRTIDDVIIDALKYKSKFMKEIMNDTL